ncbi:hypothetical protein [Streptomyces antimicrobicus]|uniref:Integral membrane protein n=1 Tax=Streptomyces antimicrobicus TaxID=2883108 RepID=A0ABS8B8Q9_9ACTN|nr:hypothetical protein [Streptomyces antimicrobicus]MCB5180989.1 hypothetical protein [Streptomyces antimicrobicus]
MPAQHRLAALAAATLVGAAVVPVLAPTAAYARPSATVSPTSVAPGSRVSLNVTGCGTKTGRATSTAFGEVSLAPGNLEATNLFGAAIVSRNARIGSHPVTFECGTGGERVTVTLNVVSGSARGGLGGSTTGVSPGQIALGGSLVAAALGSGVWYVRRRAHAM